jgi:FkbM family methyltransferase
MPQHTLDAEQKMVKTFRRYVQILRQQKHVLRFLASRVLWRSRLCSLFEIRRPSYRLKFHPTALSAILWINPLDREGDEAFLRRYLRESDIVVDVGANVGNFGLMAASVVGPKGKIYCIEAHPRTYGFLTENVALNRRSNVFLFNLALGDKKSEVLFSDLRSDDQNRISQNGSGILVPMVRLDDVPLSEFPIQLLKVDVEGYEKFVLEGAQTTLRRVSCLYLESYEHHFARYGYACGDVINFLGRSGFTVLRLIDNELVAPIRLGYSSTYCENLIAVRDLKEFLARTQYTLAT